LPLDAVRAPRTSLGGKDSKMGHESDAAPSVSLRLGVQIPHHFEQFTTRRPSWSIMTTSPAKWCSPPQPPTAEDLSEAFLQACRGSQLRAAERLLAAGADATPDYTNNRTALEAATAPDTRPDLLATWLRERASGSIRQRHELRLAPFEARTSASLRRRSHTASARRGAGMPRPRSKGRRRTVARSATTAGTRNAPGRRWAACELRECSRG
jgi:hypothetical protein